MNTKVAQAFKKLYFAKRTGILNCEANQAKRAVFFRSGFVVGARSTLDEDRLGEVMMRCGRITRRQFEDASHFIKSGWKMGAILVELNILKEREVEDFVRTQLLDIACMQLISPPRRLAFAPLGGVDMFLDAPLSVADILMEAARRTPSLDQTLELLRAESRRLVFTNDPMKRFQDIHLDPEEAFVLSRIDGTQTASEILAVAAIEEKKAARTLMGLLESGIVQPQDPVVEPVGARALRPTGHSPSSPVVDNTEPVARKVEPPTAQSAPQLSEDEVAARRKVEEFFLTFPDKDHWQVLGLDRANRAELKTAFFEMARVFHPDRFRRHTDAEFHEKVSYVFARINEAYQILSNQESTDTYEALASKEPEYRQLADDWTRGPESEMDVSKTKRAANARAFFERAKKSYERTEYWDAIQLVRKSIELVGDKAEFYHFLGLALANNPKWRLDAEKNLKIAANLEPWRPKYLISLGKLYREAGLHLRAERVFEQAKAIDPTAQIPE